MTDQPFVPAVPAPVFEGGSFQIVGDPAPLFAALARAQSAFDPIGRTKTVRVEPYNGKPYSFNYAPLEDVLAAITPSLSANGLAILQPPGVTTGGAFHMVTMLTHESGSFILSRVAIPTTIRALNKSTNEWYDRDKTAQEIGSSLTYMRRYMVQGLVCVNAEEDDDGNAGSDQPREISRQTPPKVEKPKPVPQSAPKPTELAQTQDEVNSTYKRAAAQGELPTSAGQQTLGAGLNAEAEPATPPQAPSADPPVEATKLEIKGLLQALGMQKMTTDWCQKLIGCLPKEIKTEAQQQLLLADLKARKDADGNEVSK